MWGRYLSLYCILSLTGLSVLSQIAHFEHFSDESGLPHKSIRSVTQDEKGFLWLGTFGGLCRFDGREFRIYQNSGDSLLGLPDDDITQIAYDKSRLCLWIGTNNGLGRLNLLTDSICQIYPKDTSFFWDKQIRSVYLDNNNLLLIGTRGNGVYLYTPQNRFKKLVLPNIKYVKSFYKDTFNRFWVGSLTEGIVSFRLDVNYNPVQVNYFNLAQHTKTGNISPRVFAFYESSDTLFAGTESGIFYMTTEMNSFIPFIVDSEPGINYLKKTFRCFTKDRENNLWIGTRDGIFRCRSIQDFKNKKYIRYINSETDHNSLVDNQILDIFEDSYGLIWIATETGLDKYDPYKNLFSVLRSRDGSHFAGLSHVTDFCEGYDRTLVVGTFREGLLVFDGENIRKANEQVSNVCSIHSEDGTVFWIGTWDGNLVRYNLNTNAVTFFKIPDTIDPINSIVDFDNNMLLISLYNEGLYVFDKFGHKFFRFHDTNDFSPLEINVINRSDKGDFWIGTESGLYLLDKQKLLFRNFTVKNSHGELPGDKVKSIVVDKDGVLWVGTRSGLCRILNKKNKWDIKKIELISNLWVSDIAIDKQGNLWLNTNYNYIYSYNPENEQFRRYQVYNGIQSNIFSKRGFVSWNNNVYIGGSKEVIYFIPSKLNFSIDLSAPVIAEIKIENEVIKSGMKMNGQQVLSREIAYSNKITLNHKNKNISLSVFSKAFARAAGTVYRYKMVPFENKWIKCDQLNAKNIQYTNLKSGNYEFIVSCKNDLGDWSPPARLQIRIKPPVYASLGAIVFYLVLAVLLFILIRRIITMRIALKNELLFEKLSREKEEQLKQEKIRFFNNVSHELRTPLTLILGPSEELVHGTEVENFKAYHNLIYQNAKRLLALVNQLLDFRKAEVGKISLKVSEQEIVDFTKQIINLFTHIAKEKDIELVFSSFHKKIIGWIDVDKYDKILHNLLTNAFKFTDRHGKIKVNLELKTNILEIKVSDTGKGIAPEHLEKIFERFYQIDGTSKDTKGTGIGLSMVKHLISLHKGTIHAESALNKGAVFTIGLPVSLNSYSEDEIFSIHPSDSDLISPVTLEYEELLTQRIKPSQKGVLVLVEDNPEIRRFICGILEESFLIYEAENGAEGYSLCKTKHPQIVLADVMMKVMDGFEFCSKLKSDPDISHIPVIIITALGQEESQIRSYKTGADGFIKKPFTPALIKTVVSNVIANRNILKERFSKEVETEIFQLSNSPADDNLLLKVQSIIEENLADPGLSTQILCSKLNMSASSLYRKLNELTNQSPNELIRTIRLKKAAALLKLSNHNISEVAFMVGFNDPLYFSKCFRKQFDISPTELRSMTG